MSSHLIELRGRLVSLALLRFAFALSAALLCADIQIFLIKPFQAAYALHAAAQAAGQHGGNPFELIAVTAGLHHLPPGAPTNLALQATGPLEQLFTKMKVAGFGAVVVVFPVLAWQLYKFVAPGLYRNEKGAFLPFLFVAPILFLIGAALVYFVMLPFVMWFSLSQQITADGITVELNTKISEYLSLVTSLILAFGLCFQLPVVTTLLGMAGIVSSKMMVEVRRYAIVAVVVVAAVVTPPDPISQLMLAVPLVLLYEISIWCVRLIEMRRKKADVADGLAA